MSCLCVHGDCVLCFGDGSGDLAETSDMLVAVVAIEEDDNAEGE